MTLLEMVGLVTDGLTPGMPDLFVANLGGLVVGCAALESDGFSGLLRSVGVLPVNRGAGIGEQLVEVVHVRARDLSLEWTYLMTTTADKYFPRFGYVHAPWDDLPSVVIGSAEYSQCSESGATVMRRGPWSAT